MRKFVEGKDSSPLFHELIPKHHLLSEREAQMVLQEYSVESSQLPKIYIDDPAIRHLPLKVGDVIKVIRSSPTAGVAIAYRIVISRGIERIPQTFQDTSFIKLFKGGIKLDVVCDELICKEIRKDLLAHVAPHRGIEKIIVGREREIIWLNENILDREKHSLSLIEGEIGSGKTFLLNYICELALKKNYAVSKIEVSNVRPISTVDKLYFQIINNVTIPEQPLLIGKVELLFKKILFNIYTASCEELSRLGFQASDVIRVKKVMIDKINKFILTTKQSDNRIADDLGYFFDAAIMNHDLSSDFKLHEIGLRSNESIYAFTRLIQYAGYSGLILLIDELEQERNLNMYNVIYSLQEDCPINGLKIVLAGTSDLMEEKTSGIHALKRELYDLLEKSKFSIMPLTLEHKKELARKIVEVLRCAKSIQNVNGNLVNFKIDEFFRSKEMKNIFTTRDFISNFIKYIEKELGTID